MIPEAIVVAAAGILIEVTIDVARRSRLPGNRAVVRVFGVVTGAQTIGILHVDEAVPVIVDAVAACVHVALTSSDHTSGVAPGTGRARAGGSGSRSAGHTAARTGSGSAGDATRSGCARSGCTRSRRARSRRARSRRARSRCSRSGCAGSRSIRGATTTVGARLAAASLSTGVAIFRAVGSTAADRDHRSEKQRACKANQVHAESSLTLYFRAPAPKTQALAVFCVRSKSSLR